MSKVRLIFGTYNSLPMGSYDYVFENAYQKAYKPFLTVLYNFPDFPVTMYYSGVVLQWLEEKHPEFLMLVEEMVKRKQVELLGGAFYEPVLSIIPVPDRLGQIESLTTYIRKHFGKKPRGSWIPELVWEPSLASILNNSGMDYIFLEDFRFLHAGFKEEELYYPCLTEDQGKVITVFPLSTHFREIIPSQSPESIVEKILSIGLQEKEPLISLIDTGDKFGLYEGTYNLCYREKWLESFINLILQNSEVIDPVSPLRFLRTTKPRKKGYFGSSSYEDMMGWVKTPDRIKSNNFLKGSYFRQFLLRYHESNLIYSKMIYTHILTSQIRGDKSRKKAAREELWKGQCNHAYWPGSTGGLYENHLRKAVYYSLIEAEKITHEKGIFIPSIVTADFDMDGEKEFLYQGHELNAYVHTNGGVLFELDYLSTSWNYLDTLSRYREPYHQKDMENTGYDWYMRKAFIDHFLSQEDSINAFDTMTYTELGNFVEAPYRVREFNREQKEIQLRRKGTIFLNQKSNSFEIIKKYSFSNNYVEVLYTLKNLSDTFLDIFFASEINLSFRSREETMLGIFPRVSGEKKPISSNMEEVSGIKELLLEDLYNKVRITLTASDPFDLWSLPVETVARTAYGYKNIYQSSCFLPRWRLDFSAGEERRICLGINFEKQGL
ncbi:MAG: 4-alpha-glucanotransferase [Spirochaetes bacterium]|nr:MAG: 4-alpha-glucanotransferase [Spirochaetota bacterium]